MIRPDGFKCVKWNEKPSEWMECIFNDGTKSIYTIPGEDLRYGEVEVDKIEYEFINGFFVGGRVYITGYEGFESLKETVFRKHGIGIQENKKILQWEWKDNEVIMGLIFDNNEGIFFISSFQDVSPLPPSPPQPPRTPPTPGWDPYGCSKLYVFRGLEFGESFQNMCGMRQIEKFPDNQIVVCKKDNENLIIEDTRLEEIKYWFWANRLFKIEMNFKSIHTFNCIKEGLIEMCRGNIIKNENNILKCEDKKIIVILDYVEQFSRGSLTRTFKEISNEIV